MQNDWHSFIDFWYATHNLVLIFLVGFCFLLVFGVLVLWAMLDVLSQHYAESTGELFSVRELFLNEKTRQIHRIKNSIRNEDAQLHAVQSYYGFKSKSIFNRPETALFYMVRDMLRKPAFKGWHVHGQVSMGEIIKTEYDASKNSDARRAHQSINSKRADMVVTDNFGNAAVVVEYQGEGHWNENRHITLKRDKIKRIAVERIGSRFVEIFPEMSKEAREKLIGEALRRHLEKLLPTQSADRKPRK